MPKQVKDLEICITNTSKTVCKLSKITSMTIYRNATNIATCHLH